MKCYIPLRRGIGQSIGNPSLTLEKGKKKEKNYMIGFSSGNLISISMVNYNFLAICICAFFDKRISQEVSGDGLGEVWAYHSKLE